MAFIVLTSKLQYAFVVHMISSHEFWRGKWSSEYYVAAENEEVVKKALPHAVKVLK